MKNFHKLDPSALKAFYYAALELNFTRAAEKAGLTQSGVSQHIKKLEEELNVTLFLRHHRKLQVTESAQQLLKFVENYLDSVDNLVDHLNSFQQELTGEVSYAMPDSCLFSPHLQMLIEKRNQEFRQVNLKVKICDSEDVIEHLLENRIDFGFITKPLAHRLIELKKFVFEDYIMVSAPKSKIQLSHLRDLQNVGFVEYSGSEVLFEKWCQSEFKTSKSLSMKDFRITGSISSIRGAIKMVESGLGISVFQRHCVANELQKKTLVVIGQPQGAKNPIYIARLKDQKPSMRVLKVIETFEAMKS